MTITIKNAMDFYNKIIKLLETPATKFEIAKHFKMDDKVILSKLMVLAQKGKIANVGRTEKKHRKDVRQVLYKTIDSTPFVYEKKPNARPVVQSEFIREPKNLLSHQRFHSSDERHIQVSSNSSRPILGSTFNQTMRYLEQ